MYWGWTGRSEVKIGHASKGVVERFYGMILWDFQIRTVKQMMLRQTDMVLDKGQKSAALTDIHSP